MKLRETFNNNTYKFSGQTFEDNNKIIVIKKDTFNYYDCSTDEIFEFNTISDYESWKNEQNWIKKVTKISNFKKVNRGDI